VVWRLSLLPTTEIKFKTAKYEIEKDKDKEAPDVDLNVCQPSSVLFSFKGEKNKQGTPMLEGAYRLILVNDGARLKGTIKDETVIMDQAERYGIIKKESSKWTCAGVPFATKGLIEELLIKDPTFRRVLTRRVMEQLQKD
jgi:hypothetical protein